MSTKNIDLKKYFFVIFLIAFVAMPFYNAYGAAGKIDDLSGNVSIRDKNNIPYKAAKKGDVFDKGYWIKTGSNGWASLALTDGSKITLANNTELEITEYVIGRNKKDGVFTVTQGKLRASVTRLAGERVDYKVKSATAVAGIKGTEFMMMAQGQANVFFGNEGSLGISGNAGTAKQLSADTMVQNTRGYVPVDPVKIEPQTPLHTAKTNFQEITAATPPKDWEISNNLPHIIARWNINYGHYLADAGKYDEALHVFQIALDLTDRPDIRSDARLERGAVYSSFLNNPEAALSEYLLIIEEYPQVAQREVALYNVGRTLYELGFKTQAGIRLIQYKKEYPNGRYLSNVETYLSTLGIKP
ncbi:MAG: FecR domain-containing protein [Syntrophorhabdaceae bacterium]|nr:FecR domain-containing protein [Syntrophorhabdaceae bacterium]